MPQKGFRMAHKRLTLREEYHFLALLEKRILRLYRGSRI